MRALDGLLVAFYRTCVALQASNGADATSSPALHAGLIRDAVCSGGPACSFRPCHVNKEWTHRCRLANSIGPSVVHHLHRTGLFGRSCTPLPH